ncbi:hypothetical protein IF655_20185 [Streptomyces sp. DSM 110735]|uniref:hypothetical protein n=1 Tax=Streptomyces sp. DSM 110735 TaxID=2775031 RepID=UPI0018F68295|nr:hypothetical protein [Streptomyces sp. DSM 110735]MBJ7905607.1 hypothetical protein [Streptomyces sp. DSM 110735]
MTTSTDQIPAPPGRRRTGLRLFSYLVAAAFLALAAILAPAPPAMAAARVSASPATADPEYATQLRLHGAGFQSVKNGFGGVYVLFGTVSGTWRPSQGGTSGIDYVYVQDSETKDNHGYQRFVAFPGDPTAYAANGGTVRADGTWDATLVVPGAVFPAKGRDGAVRQIDCRKVRCGVITIGAHGVANPRNETFTPVDFAAPGAGRAPATKSAHPSPSKAKRAESAKPTPAASPSSSAAAASTSAPATPTASPSSTPAVAADPVVSATSVSGTGLLVAGCAVVVVVAVILSALWLSRRRKRGGTSVNSGEK